MCPAICTFEYQFLKKKRKEKKKKKKKRRMDGNQGIDHRKFLFLFVLFFKVKMNCKDGHSIHLDEVAVVSS